MFFFLFHDVIREMLMFELNEIGLTNLSIPILFDCSAHLDDLNAIKLVQLAVYRFILHSRRFNYGR